MRPELRESRKDFWIPEFLGSFFILQNLSSVLLKHKFHIAGIPD
jgi:hypothetical protein